MVHDIILYTASYTLQKWYFTLRRTSHARVDPNTRPERLHQILHSASEFRGRARFPAASGYTAGVNQRYMGLRVGSVVVERE